MSPNPPARKDELLRVPIFSAVLKGTFGRMGLESRLQAVFVPHRLKAGLQTEFSRPSKGL